MTGQLGEKIERDGFAVERGVLSSSEVERLQASLANHFASGGRLKGLGKHQPDAAVEIEGIAWVFSHPAIVNSFRDILGGRTPVFTGNCDAHQDMLSWWHRDAAPSDNLGDDSIAKPTCDLYRAGIYLEDHQGTHDGLTVSRGSHRIEHVNLEMRESLDTRVGDVVFFDIRLAHAGKFADPLEELLLKAGRLLRGDAEVTKIKEWYWRLARKRHKRSLFFTFGAEGRMLDAFCSAELRRRAERSPLASRCLSPELIQGLESVGAAAHPLLAAGCRSDQPREGR